MEIREAVEEAMDSKALNKIQSQVQIIDLDEYLFEKIKKSISGVKDD